jgi:hypothetical protein
MAPLDVCALLRGLGFVFGGLFDGVLFVIGVGMVKFESALFRPSINL